MLRAAFESASQGAYVVVITTTQQIPDMQRRITQMCVDANQPHVVIDGQKVYIGWSGQIAFQSPNDRKDWDWKQMRGVTAHQACKFFTDHYVIESTFSRMLDELHKYDS